MSMWLLASYGWNQSLERSMDALPVQGKDGMALDLTPLWRATGESESSEVVVPVHHKRAISLHPDKEVDRKSRDGRFMRIGM